MIVVGPEVVRWVEQQLGEEYALAEGIGLVRGDKLIAGVVYNAFGKNGCNMHVASISPRWFTPEFAKAAFSVPFIQWGYERVTGLVYEDNKKARAFDERIGFVLEGKLRGKRPVLVYGMLKEECRWLYGNGFVKRCAKNSGHAAAPTGAAANAAVARTGDASKPLSVAIPESGLLTAAT